MTDQGQIYLLPAPRKLHRLPGVSSASLETFVGANNLPPQGYRLSIQSQSMRILARDAAGAFYARQTLAQLHRQFGSSVPCLEIEDSPDFPVRGVMLDISRDKVPTMDTLLSLIDQLAEWKINHLQLYTEHTFAYAGHETVWQNASPMTPEEIEKLDAYCRQRFIDLVPNQNSFGHMKRWLKHPRYTPLAEVPEKPYGLCPTDPRSIELLADLYAQLLPHFSSRLFNVGCDETLDLGEGRSRAECEKIGKPAVYLQFLKKVHHLVQSHGRQMMFWGDIILDHPDLIPHLPPQTIALNWGYEADHPFDRQTKLFRESGVPFYVCAGTSSWNSITGRTDNMLANQRTAAESGMKNGAVGYLNTDWGDYGHLQYLPISFAGVAAGAAMSWCRQSNTDLPLAQTLSLHAFDDPSGITGRVALDLGNVYQSVGKLIPNRSALFSILVPSSAKTDPMEGLSAENLRAASTAITTAIVPLASANISRPDAALILEEFQNAAAMLQFACHPDPDALQSIIQTHRRLWLARNRPGGLEDSVNRLAHRAATFELC